MRRIVAVAVLTVACTISSRRAAPNSPVDPTAVHEGYMKTGGIDQWITSNGANRRNPVILNLRGTLRSGLAACRYCSSCRFLLE